MKKYTTIYAFALLMLFTGVNVPYAQVLTEVNTNGDFSESTVGDTPGDIAEWSFNGTDNADYEIIADPDDAENNVLKVTLNDLTDLDAWSVQGLQTVELLGGSTYQASIRVKAENPDAATVQLDGGTGAQLWGQAISGTEWTTLTTDSVFVESDKEQNFAIHFSHEDNAADQIIYVDYLSVSRIDSVVNTNGDFSESTVGDVPDNIDEWSFNGTDNADFEVIEDSDDAENNILEATLNDIDGLDAWSVQALQNVGLERGYYQASIRVKAENPDAATVQLDGGPGAQLWGQAISGTEWTTLTTDVFLVEGSGDRNFGIHLSHEDNADSQTIYVDQLVVTKVGVASDLGPMVTSGWARGFDGHRGWNISDFASEGDGATVSGEGAPDLGGWGTLRYGFPDTLEATESEAVVVTGQLEFLGGDATTWNVLRFGLYNWEDAGTILDDGEPEARWSGSANAYGYLFTPRSGTNEDPGWTGGAGTHGVVNGENWITTNGPVTAGRVAPAPRRAELTQGVYDFAFSVLDQGDGTNEVKFYLTKEEEGAFTYWFGGSFIDTAQTTTQFNGVVFGINNGNGIGDTGINGLTVSDLEVTTGNEITVPEAPFSPFWASDWGFLGGKLGGESETDSAWTLIPNGPNNFAGDVMISGPAATGWANIATDFGTDIVPSTDEALQITGNVILGDGGFEEAESFRFGFFDAANIGTLDSTETVGYVWDGVETEHNGYLFSPSAEMDKISSVSDDAWYSATSGLTGWESSSGTPGAGTYNLIMSVNPTESGANEIRVKLQGDEYLYEAYALDESDPLATTTFNSAAFGISNSSTTSMFLEEIRVELVDPSEVEVSNEDEGNLNQPITFALEQNYPNPFNPSTKINYSVPQTSDVKIEVYDIMGRLVSTLVNETKTTGTYTVNFNASNFASGMYIYRITAGSFVSTKKMMLIK